MKHGRSVSKQNGSQRTFASKKHGRSNDETRLTGLSSSRARSRISYSFLIAALKTDATRESSFLAIRVRIDFYSLASPLVSHSRFLRASYLPLQHFRFDICVRGPGRRAPVKTRRGRTRKGQTFLKKEGMFSVSFRRAALREDSVFSRRSLAPSCETIPNVETPEENNSSTGWI